jgi:hypothetical protein
VGQKEVWPTPAGEVVVIANQLLLLLRQLVVSKCRMVVKTNHHQSRNEPPVVQVAVGAVGGQEEGVATGVAEVAVPARAESAAAPRRRKETQTTPLPLLRGAVHSRRPTQTLKVEKQCTGKKKFFALSIFVFSLS